MVSSRTSSALISESSAALWPTSQVGPSLPSAGSFQSLLARLTSPRALPASQACYRQGVANVRASRPPPCRESAWRHTACVGGKAKITLGLPCVRIKRSQDSWAPHSGSQVLGTPPSYIQQLLLQVESVLAPSWHVPGPPDNTELH